MVHELLQCLIESLRRDVHLLSKGRGPAGEIMLLEFDEVEEGDQQENPQVAAPEGEEQNPEELPECPDHHPTSFLRGKPQSILSLLVFYK